MNDTLRRIHVIAEFRSLIDELDDISDEARKILENAYVDLLSQTSLYFDLLTMVSNTNSKPQDIKKRVIGFKPNNEEAES